MMISLWGLYDGRCRDPRYLFFFQADDGIRDLTVTGVQTCALPISNSFAIEGHYFNFSTSGQWLWDELQVVLPAGQDPYPIVNEIRKKASEATKESAKQAERSEERRVGKERKSRWSRCT